MNEDKATRYHRLRRRADLLGTSAAGVVLLALSISGGSARLRELGAAVSQWVPETFNDAVMVTLVTILVMLLLAIVELPFAYYHGYLLEHRYGLSTQTRSHWVSDQLKGVILGIALAVLGTSTVYYALREWPDAWWWIAAAIFAVATIGLTQLAPVVLLPIFYKFTPLDRPALTERLLQLASRARTHVNGVFVWVLSSHTRKANAALAGLGRTRRILLSDTLLADYSDDEVEVILAHELAHHVHHDLWRGIALQAAALFGGFFVASVLLSALADWLGLRGLSDPSGLPALLLIGGVWTFLWLPVVNAVSRAQERAADRYALQTTRNVDAFVTAMKRLSQQNLAEEHPAAIVRFLFYSHPPIRERIDAARAFGREEHHAA
ncbi:MAG: M48 family metallopeptidase [Vicinamibacterales bacterium]